MKQITCDKCGQTKVPEFFSTEIRITDQYGARTDTDLCPSCVERFRSWLAEGVD